MTRKSLDIGN